MPTINRSPGTLNANYEQCKAKYTTTGAFWVVLKSSKVLYCTQLYSKWLFTTNAKTGLLYSREELIKWPPRPILYLHS